MSSSVVGRSSQESKHGVSDGAHVETWGWVAGSGWRPAAEIRPLHKLSELQQQQWPGPLFTHGDINPQLPPGWYLLIKVPLDNTMIVRLIIRASSAHKLKVLLRTPAALLLHAIIQSANHVRRMKSYSYGSRAPVQVHIKHLNGNKTRSPCFWPWHVCG